LKEEASTTLTKEVSKREEKTKEIQVMHEALVVELKDKFTQQRVDLERKLESLQKKYDDETLQMSTRLGDLEKTTRAYEGEIKQHTQ
jgi:hypothetical protein